MDWKFVRKILSFFLAWLMVYPSGPPWGFAKDDAAKDAQRVSDVKEAVIKLGAGKDARVMLVLRNGKRVGGYVQQAQENDFSVHALCSDNDTPVPFAQVRSLSGLNIATGTKVSAGKGVSAKAAAGLAVDDPCRTTIIQEKRLPPRHHNLITVIVVTCLFAAIFIPLWVAASEHKD